MAEKELRAALATLRHLYANMINGAVRDTASAKRIATGLLGPAIEGLERASLPSAGAEPTWECPDCHKWPEGCKVGHCAIGCLPPTKGAEEPDSEQLIATAATAQREALANWAAERWHAEVASRPIVNVHRRALDDTWRQVLRRCGVDDRARLGPTHDELRAEIGSKEWEAMNGGSK